MAKTTFTTGVRAPAAFWTAVNAHYQSGRDVDGEGALTYAVDTGAVNAITIALSPALPAYIAGMPIYFKAANTGTGAATINVNGLGLVDLIRNDGSALQAGDIITGAIYKAIYDGADMRLMNPSNA